MMGLRILLEGQKNVNKGPVINKINMIKSSPPPTNSSSASSTPPSSLYSPSPLPAITFLDSCFLCKQRLLPGKDIYMYKGDRAFCSVECRCRQIYMDEESVGRKKKNCSLAAMNAKVKPTSLASPPASSSRHYHRRGTRNRAGGFA